MMTAETGVKRNIADLKAPVGKTRVVVFDITLKESHLVDDCNTPEEAFMLADSFNAKRNSKLSDVYRVYDDRGDRIPGNEEG